MVLMRKITPLIAFLFLLSCVSAPAPLRLQLTEDQLVHALVEMYTVNAALQLNDVTYRDSLSNVYYKQVEKNLGIPVEQLRTDLEQLLQHPDSLVRLENRALDTLRVLLEKNPSPTPFVIGKN
jgi:hypothetical protein